MNYRVGLPLWKTLGRLGVPLKLTVCVHRDDAAGVYFADSRDLPGLVVEAATLDALAAEVHAGVETLLEELLPEPHPAPVTYLRIDGAPCAA